MTIALNERIIRNSDLISASFDEDLVMLSIQTGRYYGVNSVGRRIWELLEESRTVASLCDRLVQEFEVTPLKCQEEVLIFLNALNEQGLLLKQSAV